MFPSSIVKGPDELAQLIDQRNGLWLCINAYDGVGVSYFEGQLFPFPEPPVAERVRHLPKRTYDGLGSYNDLVPYEVADLVLAHEVPLVQGARRENLPAEGRRRFLVAGLNQEGRQLLLTRELSDVVIAIPAAIELTAVRDYIPLGRR